MRKILIGIGVLLVLIIGAIALVPSLVPSEVYKEKIQTQLTKELERDVSIDGDVKLSVFPSIRAKTDRVVIANPEGYSENHFAAMDGLEAKIKLFPLFSKRVEIAAFKLKNPQISLEKKADSSANWVFGDPSKAEAPKSDEGPFKRDGRYADMDPAIGLFSIENGAISYRDANQGIIYDLKDVNLAFALPSLSKTIKIDGNVVFNDEPVSVKLSLDSPRKFLDGKATPVTLALKTEFAEINTKGEFLESQDIAFTLDVDGNVSNTTKLMSYVPNDLPVSDFVNAANLKGTYSFDGSVFSAKSAEISATGTGLDVAFKGDATLTEDPVLNGNVNLNAGDLARIAKAFNLDIPGLDLAETVNFSADLATRGKAITAKNVDAIVKGNDLNATFKGDATLAESSPVLDGKVNFNANDMARIAKAFDLDIQGLNLAQSLELSADLAAQGKGFAAKNIDATVKGQDLKATFKGEGTFSDTITANGAFTAVAGSVPALVQALKLDMPQAKALGNADINGKVAYSGTTTKLTDLKVMTNGGVVEGNYAGSASLGDTVELSGTFNTVLQSLTEFVTQTGMDIPYANSVGRIKAQGNVSGAGDALSISALVAELSEGQLNGKFEGGANLNNGVKIDGNLNADIPSVRTLAATTGTQLPPNTKAGQIYEAFKVSGQVNGTPENISFQNANIALDKLAGTGTFAVSLKGAKPFVTGQLNLAGLDLRPYMASYAAQNPTGEIQPWSEDQLNLTMLRSVDGDFTFTTPNIITDRMEMGQSDIKATLRNGRLDAKLPKLNLYGGLGSVTAALDASGNVPALSLDVNMDDLNSNSFLNAVAGFTNVKGEGNTLLSVKGQGTSQAAIMKSLNGTGDFKLLNGEISGVDLSTLMSGLEQALSTRSLPGGIGKQYTTKFQDIVGLFKIENGVAKINQFNLSGYGVAAQGGGTIDLGNQNIDFNLRPRLTGETASNLASFGIPIKLQGNFGSVSAGLDTDMLGQIVAAQAKARLQKELTNQVGGTAGSILGGILGGGTTQTPAPSKDTKKIDTSNQSGQPRPEPTVEDLLGTVFGKKPTEPPTTTPDSPDTTEPKKKEEPTVEDALLDLFGAKKKKKD